MANSGSTLGSGARANASGRRWPLKRVRVRSGPRPRRLTVEVPYWPWPRPPATNWLDSPMTPEASGSCLITSTTVGAPCLIIVSWVTTSTGSAAVFGVPAMIDPVTVTPVTSVVAADPDAAAVDEAVSVAVASAANAEWEANKQAASALAETAPKNWRLMKSSRWSPDLTPGHADLNRSWELISILKQKSPIRCDN